jgi:hypothetical protein
MQRHQVHATLLVIAGLIVGLGISTSSCAGETTAEQPADTTPQATARAALEALRNKAASFPSVRYTVHGTQTIPPGPEAVLYEGHPPKETVTIAIWRKGSHRRQDTTLSSGEHVVVIEGPDGRYASDPATEFYTRSELDAQEQVPPWVSCQPVKESDTAKILRKETVEGIPVTVFEQTLADGPAVVKAWVRDDTGFAVRTETVMSWSGSSVLMIAECSQFSFDVLPDSLFQVPQGKVR